jgi:hypothetical protein
MRTLSKIVCALRGRQRQYWTLAVLTTERGGRFPEPARFVEQGAGNGDQVGVTGLQNVFGWVTRPTAVVGRPQAMVDRSQ